MSGYDISASMSASNSSSSGISSAFNFTGGGGKADWTVLAVVGTGLLMVLALFAVVMVRSK